MENQMLWGRSGFDLTPKSAKFGSRRLSKEQYALATKLERNFVKWAVANRKARHCYGKRIDKISGFGIACHSGCCGSLFLLFNTNEIDTLKEYAALPQCDIQGIEAQAEIALRLYQRIKSEEIPYSKDKGKQRTARYRQHRQNWLEILKIKTHTLTTA